MDVQAKTADGTRTVRALAQFDFISNYIFLTIVFSGFS